MPIMREKTMSEVLGEILDDFAPAVSQTPGIGPSRGGQPVTIWLRAEDKVRYDRIQRSSGRRFSKKAREVILALIELAEAKVS